MFGIFSASNEASNTNPRNEVEYTSSDEDDLTIVNLFDTPLSENKWILNNREIVVCYYFTPIAHVLQYLRSWCLQRNINSQHKDSIKESIRQSHHLMGTIQILMFRNGQMRVINGQHRVQALKEIIEEDFEFNINIMLEVYKVDFDEIDCIDDQEIIYNLANKNLPIEMDSKAFLCKRIIKEMLLDPTLKKGLIEKDTGRVNNVKEIIKKIKKINEDIGLTSRKTLFRGKEKEHATQITKAENMRFFLNMDCTQKPSVWIKRI